MKCSLATRSVAAVCVFAPLAAAESLNVPAGEAIVESGDLYELIVARETGMITMLGGEVTDGVAVNVNGIVYTDIGALAIGNGHLNLLGGIVHEEVLIDDDASLLLDGGETGRITVTTNATAELVSGRVEGSVRAHDDAHLTLNGDVRINRVTVENNASFTMNGGRLFGFDLSSTADAFINGGTFNGGTATLHDGCSLTLTDGVFNSGIDVEGGVFKITGGSLANTSSSMNIIDFFAPATVEISGGSFAGPVNVFGNDLVIHGGDFQDVVHARGTSTSNPDSTITINGVSFTHDDDDDPETPNVEIDLGEDGVLALRSDDPLFPFGTYEGEPRRGLWNLTFQSAAGEMTTLDLRVDPRPNGYAGTIILQSVPLAADLNGDGSIDSGDLAILLAGWGGIGAADLNGDGVVDSGDLAILLAAWG